MASAKIILSAITAATRILFGFLIIYLGLIYGTVIGNIFAIAAFIFFFIKRNKMSSFGLVSVAKMGKMFNEYKDFFKYSTPGALLNAFANTGLPLLIAYFYSVELAGIYFFANNLIQQPISLLSNATAQVFKAEAVQFVHTNQTDNLIILIHKVQKSIFLLAFFVILILSLFGKPVFSFVFGNQWGASGDLIKYFSFALLFSFSFSIISALIDILRLQKFALFFNASLLFSQVAIFIGCSFFLDLKYTLLINSIVVSLHFIFIDKYVKRKLT